ncbi:MAG: hypothetical protein COU35_03680 [Candidatus Magasanikbacteria bacterium CG10_big_fil_rev_8_21_14_0_10_47_10]|uniref:Uncharacterized protein n=1 Tax=Candidatus Magasanikbacteria bacterium CG10_big_fil_rev_8_21_14_0_10_47_10 TaxID=1974652 RepID=A0A2H0TPY4_9BACT|nr:MAG: hypothetical protein COU35_03680 [Candidatus Magasanikbacteria bacterium CG10_big_fil_rev_8_21_14_0_10_47_10]
MNDADQHRLTREQKVGFTLLLVFGILTVGLGFLQMRNTLYGPFISRVTAKPADDISQLFSDDQVRLQAIDTDQDGINNYEELFFYNTSPYLSDTDSDGIPDKTEIDAGTDPLCPQGERCSDVDNLGQNATSTGGLFAVDPANAPQAPNLPLLGEGNPAAQITSPEQLNAIVSDADSIRQLLMQTGQFSADQLAQIQDDELLALVQDFVAEQQANDAALQDVAPIDNSIVVPDVTQ